MGVAECSHNQLKGIFLAKLLFTLLFLFLKDSQTVSYTFHAFKCGNGEPNLNRIDSSMGRVGGWSVVCLRKLNPAIQGRNY